MGIFDPLLIVILDEIFDITAKTLSKYRLIVDKSGVSIKNEGTTSIDDRIAKIDDAKTSLLEGVRLIDELREAAETNKKDAELALADINKLAADKANVQKELDAIRNIAQADVEIFKRMAGVPSAHEIRRERIIGFVSGVVSSLIASGLIWISVLIIQYFFS
jgi:rRNA-processing protein FCF1